MKRLEGSNKTLLKGCRRDCSSCTSTSSCGNSRNNCSCKGEIVTVGVAGKVVPVRVAVMVSVIVTAGVVGKVVSVGVVVTVGVIVSGAVRMVIIKGSCNRNCRISRKRSKDSCSCW